MQWFEYLIILAALALVALPIVLAVRSRKKGKPSPFVDCGDCAGGCKKSGGCGGCPYCPPRRDGKKDTEK